MTFYPLTPELSQKLRKAKLTAAEWRLWHYLTEVDPWGDRYKDLNPLTIMAECGMSKPTYYRAKAKFQELGLFDFQEEKVSFRNLNGVSKARLDSQEFNSESQKFNSQSQKFNSESQKFNSESQKRKNQSSKPAQSKGSTTSQTIQTNKTIQTLSESEGENISEEEKFSQTKITDIDQPKKDSAITVSSSVVENFSGHSPAREKHELLTYAGDDTPWLNPPRRRNDINFKQEFMQWHGVRWMLKFTKRDIHEAIADFRSSLINCPDKIPGRWEEYQSHIIHHAENIQTRLEAGIEISSEEQQKMLTHLPVVSATSVNIPTINGSAENPAAYLPFVPPQFTLAQLQKMHGSKWREAAEHFGYSQEEIEEFDFQSF